MIFAYPEIIVVRKGEGGVDPDSEVAVKGKGVSIARRLYRRRSNVEGFFCIAYPDMLSGSGYAAGVTGVDIAVFALQKQHFCHLAVLADDIKP